MKNLLPKSSKKGFTLIELLVVIAILAVLAIMGFAAFRGFTGRGNDARRMADLKALGDAMEAGRPVGSSTYGVLGASSFASGSIPTDPTTGKNYCASWTTVSTANTFPNTPVTWTSGCTTTGASSNWSAWTAVGTASPATGSYFWQICASLDNTPGSSDGVATVRCRNSAQ